MRTTSYRFLALLLIACGLIGCGNAPDRELKVFAAASLGEVVGELSNAYQERHPDTAVSINLAGSNVLARQINDGAAADLFLSANRAWMTHLEEHSRLLPGSRTPLLGNRLVIVSASGAGWSLDDISQLPQLDFRYLALANPEAVPAGVYARQYFESIEHGSGNLWQLLEDRVAPAADVRRALSMARADPSVIAVVYATDLKTAPDMELLSPVPEDAVEIRYEAAIVAASAAQEDAQRFLEFLSDPAAQAIYRRYGFGVVVSHSAGD